MLGIIIVNNISTQLLYQETFQPPFGRARSEKASASSAAATRPTLSPRQGICRSDTTADNPETLCYCERKELIPRPRRSDGGIRFYDVAYVDRLRLIRWAKELGFTLAEVEGLPIRCLKGKPAPPSRDPSAGRKRTSKCPPRAASSSGTPRRVTRRLGPSQATASSFAPTAACRGRSSKGNPPRAAEDKILRYGPRAIGRAGG